MRVIFVAVIGPRTGYYRKCTYRKRYVINRALRGGNWVLGTDMTAEGEGGQEAGEGRRGRGPGRAEGARIVSLMIKGDGEIDGDKEDWGGMGRRIVFIINEFRFTSILGDIANPG